MHNRPKRVVEVAGMIDEAEVEEGTVREGEPEKLRVFICECFGHSPLFYKFV